MSIKDFDMTTGKAIDPRRRQIILAMQDADDVDIMQQVLREKKLHLLGKETDSRAVLELARKFKMGTVFLDADIAELKINNVLVEFTKKFPDFFLVVLSRSFTKESLEETKKLGANTHLAKPLKRDAVLKAVSHIK